MCVCVLLLGRFAAGVPPRAIHTHTDLNEAKHTHTRTHQPFARRYKYKLLSIRILLGATHPRDQNSGYLQNNLELKSKPDLKFTSSLTINGKFETAILDETRTSAQGKVKVHLKDTFWTQFAHTPTKRSKIRIFNRYTTLTTRNTPHTHLRSCRLLASYTNVSNSCSGP